MQPPSLQDDSSLTLRRDSVLRSVRTDAAGIALTIINDGQQVAMLAKRVMKAAEVLETGNDYGLAIQGAWHTGEFVRFSLFGIFR